MFFWMTWWRHWWPLVSVHAHSSITQLLCSLVYVACFRYVYPSVCLHSTAACGKATAEESGSIGGEGPILSGVVVDHFVAIPHRCYIYILSSMLICLMVLDHSTPTRFDRDDSTHLVSVWMCFLSVSELLRFVWFVWVSWKRRLHLLSNVRLNHFRFG